MPNILLFLVLLFLLALVGWAILALTIAILKWLAVNAITGLIIIGVLNFLGVTHVPINWLTLLILAIGGVIGAFILIILSLF
ncbi:pro-sigmaK processing inhibitor BofA family protein [Thermococcus henrietii]|uniref:pro-sigmaK processing inhibitor BofA family protein n=1 Tax=Thermococcus henrietii TaxID=2016361 RepID=UPI000C07DA3B|nr:pro-sigmaK processing inhibitor BofA family protein [Thermococcus henrietii]